MMLISVLGTWKVSLRSPTEVAFTWRVCRGGLRLERWSAQLCEKDKEGSV